MKAIGFSEFGGPDVLGVVDLPEPIPGSGQVRIRVHAAAVNPADTGLRSGRQAKRLESQQPPFIAGMDASGVIDLIGPDNDDRLHVGQAVMALIRPTFPEKGAYAEQVIVPAESVVAMPAGFDFVKSAAVLMNAATAQLAIDALELKPGDLLLATGAAGAVGGHILEIGHHSGYSMIGDASPDDHALVESLGAELILPRGDDLAAKIRQAHPSGVDGLIDAAVMGPILLPALRDGGGFTILGFWLSENPDRGIHIHEVLVGRSATDTALLDRIRGYLEHNIIRPRIAEVLPAEDAATAHRLLEAGGVRGRIILDLTSIHS